MKTAAWRRGEIVSMIHWGEAGAKASMPLDIAALCLGWPKESLEKLGERRQKLGISVTKQTLTVEILPRSSDRKAAYEFFYGLIQAAHQGAADKVLAVPQALQTLLKELPELKEDIEVLQSGNYLPDEELRLLSLHLMAYYGSLGDKSNLPHWRNVLSSVSA